jgi:hypothetical protein
MSDSVVTLSCIYYFWCARACVPHDQPATSVVDANHARRRHLTWKVRVDKIPVGRKTHNHYLGARLSWDPCKLKPALALAVYEGWDTTGWLVNHSQCLGFSLFSPPGLRTDCMKVWAPFSTRLGLVYGITVYAWESTQSTFLLYQCRSPACLFPYRNATLPSESFQGERHSTGKTHLSIKKPCVIILLCGAQVHRDNIIFMRANHVWGWVGFVFFACVNSDFNRDLKWGYLILDKSANPVSQKSSMHGLKIATWREPIIILYFENVIFSYLASN